MTGIQALERKHPTRLMAPGQAERREFEYIRHGTITLIANFDVAQGTVVTPSLGPTRTEEDFVAHMMRTGAADPAVTRWHFVTDNRNIHQSASLGRFVAEPDGLPDDVGHKGTQGILRSMTTRAAFLAEPPHRIGLHYTPKHASWMKQIELWFSILVRKLLKAGQLHRSGGCASAHLGICGVLQYHKGETLSVDLWTETTLCLKGALFPQDSTRHMGQPC
jgi:putative transposase